MMNPALSIIILTRDEAADLPRCLAALAGWGYLVVVDSGSTDDTVELARAAGARVYVHPFAGFGQQRNWALAHTDLTTPWVLFLDADEVATPEFRAAVDTGIRGAAGEVAGFFLCWRTLLDGRWLRRCDSFPKWQFRLLRRGRATFVDSGHGQKEGDIDGRLETIGEPYDHHAFSKGWTSWLHKHNRYSSQEAAERLRASPGARWRDALRARDGSARNRLLKPLVTRLPGWPLLRFLHMYLLKGGFREGRAGLAYCVNMAYYEFLIRLKMREMEPPGRSPRPPA